VSKPLHNFKNHVGFGQNSWWNNKIAISITNQKLKLFFEVWFCGMMYIQDTRGNLCSRWVSNSACYAIRVITPLMTEDTLRMIYHAYVHSIITYGIIFWRNLPHSTHIFKMQKKIIWIMTKSRGKDSCR
jgi:hypothetical protein